jgi:hypothetical protein
VQVYGMTWMELIQEEFEVDGRHDAVADMTMERQPDQRANA